VLILFKSKMGKREKTVTSVEKHTHVRKGRHFTFSFCSSVRKGERRVIRQKVEGAAQRVEKDEIAPLYLLSPQGRGGDQWRRISRGKAKRGPAPSPTPP